MPSDVQIRVPVGIGGLNLRESPAELGTGELTDSVNWRIDQAGALVKRLGVKEWADDVGHAILSLMILRISGGDTHICAHTDDGHVYDTTDGVTWTDADSGLSTDTGVNWVQYLDKLYWSDGTSAPRQWTGSSLTVLANADVNAVQTVTVTGTPTGGTFALTCLGQTATILYNSTAAQMQTALRGLSSVGSTGVTCAGSDLPGGSIACTFVGTLAQRPITTMTTSDSFTGGTAPASHVTATTAGAAEVPKGTYLAVWRNRLWISGVSAHSRRVYWSVAADPTSFIYKTNYVDFPDDTEITALAAAQNISSGVDGSDGLLVFTKTRTHRITDDSDNIGSTITGGANVLVDTAIGCVSHRSVASIAGRTYFLGPNGVYSTNGHSQARGESLKISPIFQAMSWAESQNFDGTAWENRRYLLAYTPSGEDHNTRVLELALDLPQQGGQHSWMAHSMTISSMVVADTPTGEILYGADSSLGDEGFVRQLFTGGYDVEGDSTQNDIRASCRTGSQLFGTQQVKRMRRIELLGRGLVTVAVSPNLSLSAGESRSFDMVGDPGTIWGTASWGAFLWGSTNHALEKTQYYSQRGRYLALEFIESGQVVVSKPRSLGYAGGEDGGAAIYSAILKITPLDSD